MFATPTSRAGRGRSSRASFRTGDKLIFPMATVPPGWVLDTTHNDKALRIVNTTGGGSGGVSSFSTVFGKTATDPTTLTTATFPSHAHGVNNADNLSTAAGGGSVAAAGANFPGHTVSLTNTGSDGSHTHGMDIRVQYVDAIIGRKL
jgi:hypothetical protein